MLVYYATSIFLLKNNTMVSPRYLTRHFETISRQPPDSYQNRAIDRSRGLKGDGYKVFVSKSPIVLSDSFFAPFYVLLMLLSCTQSYGLGVNATPNFPTILNFFTPLKVFISHTYLLDGISRKER